LAALGAAGVGTLLPTDTQLESGRIGFGGFTRANSGAMLSMLHRFSHQHHYLEQQQQQQLSPVDHETSLVEKMTLRWGQLHQQSHQQQKQKQQKQQPTDLRTKKIQQEYEMQGVIGEGGFGLVHIGRHRATNAPVAIKRVCKQLTSKEKFLQEVAILRQVGDNSSVLHVTDAFETSDSYVLVTELVDGGELYDHLVTRGVFKEPRAQQLAQEITSALAYLHAHRVVHADIKLENILLCNEESSSSNVRLIDFGLAFREDRPQEHECAVSSGVGTTAYAAPEYVQKQACGTAIDMWAFGVVLYVMLCGRHPFDPTDNASDEEMKTRILAGDFDRECAAWKRMSASARDLIQRMLVVDPIARITADEVLQHDWMQTASA